jgi:hypothetical protein
MSSTYVSKRAVVKLNDDADPFVLTLTETCESNVDPQVPKFSAHIFGRLSCVLPKIISESYFFADHGLRGGRGRSITPAYDLGEWNKAFKNATNWPTKKIRVPVLRRYSGVEEAKAFDQRKSYVEDLCKNFGASNIYLESDRKISGSSKFEFDLSESGTLLVLNELFNNSKTIPVVENSWSGKFIAPYEVFDGSYVHIGMPSQPIAMPCSTGKAENFSVISLNVQRPEYGQHYFEKFTCIVQDDCIVSNDALRWICSHTTYVNPNMNPLSAARTAIKQYRERMILLPVYSNEHLKLTALPLSSEAVEGLTEWQVKDVNKIGLTDNEIDIPGDKILQALQCTDFGVKLRVKLSSGELESTDTLTQEELAF